MKPFALPPPATLSSRRYRFAQQLNSRRPLSCLMSRQEVVRPCAELHLSGGIVTRLAR
jgi:hypothetical protein